MAFTCRMFLAAGATRVLPPTGRAVEIRTQADVAQLERVVRHQADVTGFARPIQGGAVAGDDARRATVDPRGQVHGVADLFVCDASVFPSSTRVNPRPVPSWPSPTPRRGGARRGGGARAAADPRADPRGTGGEGRMSVASRVAAVVARRRLARLRACAEDAGPVQERVFRRLLRAARRTAFGREHGLGAVRTRADWADAVPLRDYAGMATSVGTGEVGGARRLVAGDGAVLHALVGHDVGREAPARERGHDPQRAGRGVRRDGPVPGGPPDADLLGGELLFLGGATRLREEGPALVGDMTGILATRMPGVYSPRARCPGRRSPPNRTGSASSLAAAAAM